MTVQRMDNVGIMVESLDAAISFFTELGLELEGEPRSKGLGRARHRAAPHAHRDCHDAHAGRQQPARDLTISHAAYDRRSQERPRERSRLLRIMFAVDDIDDTLARLVTHGAQLVSSEVVQYEDSYRLCYLRGPEGLLIGLAEQIR